MDVLKRPELSDEIWIIATPTLNKLTPEPQRKIIADLSNRDRLLFALYAPAGEGAERPS